MLRGLAVSIIDFLHLRPLVEYIIGFKNQNKYLGIVGKKIFFMMTPLYGNIGDQAICLGTREYLKKFYPEYKIIEIDLKSTYKSIPAVKESISQDDIIVLQGGGNMGDLYQYIEDYRRAILKEFKEYNIISMPVTATFTKSKKGMKELARSMKIYDACKNFTIITREQLSYDYLKVHLKKCRIVCNPDMAFYLENSSIVPSCTRGDRILVCLRHDWEMIDERTDNLVNGLFSSIENSVLVDTTITRDISAQCRDAEVGSFLRDLSMSKLIITNRLHAMIMAYITKTPCIVTKALDWKINGSYEWIKNSKNIVFLQEFTVENIIEAMGQLDSSSDKMDELSKYFIELRTKISSEMIK